MERLRAYYLEGAGGQAPTGATAMTTEMFDAVLATKPVSPLDFDARLKALSAFLELPESASLTRCQQAHRQYFAQGWREPTRGDRRRESARGGRGSALRLHARAARRCFRRHGGSGSTRTRSDAWRNFGRPSTRSSIRSWSWPTIEAARQSPWRLLAQMHGLFAGVADLSRLPG